MSVFAQAASIATICLLILTAAEAALATVGAELPVQRDFRLSCSGCHGVDGRGPGMNAPGLSAQPPDLTTLSHRNGNVFPRDRLRRIIDGREMGKEHDNREMPIWGLVFKRDAEEGLGGAEVYDVTVQKRIDRLIDFIETLQR